jgi:hypothetical protein
MRTFELYEIKVQNRMRELISEMLIKNNLSLSAIAKEARISYKSLHSFCVLEQEPGMKVLVGIAHALHKYGYDLEEK